MPNEFSEGYTRAPEGKRTEDTRIAGSTSGSGIHWESHASPGCPPGGQGRKVNLRTEEERREGRTLDLGSESRDGGLTSFPAEKVISRVTLSSSLYLLHPRLDEE